MSLNELAREIYGISKSKGFWPDPDLTDANGNPQYERNPFEVLALIHSEISECLEAMRDGKWADSTSWHVTKDTQGPELLIEEGEMWTTVAGTRIKVNEKMLLMWGYVPKPEGVGSELADVIIRVLDACGAWRFDIEKAVRDKIRYNATREHKHGRAV